ncbi:hypothetical protein NM688_g6297 [Phlebia brevispora]|uniref:Uncharacterized protein n=1 Tax=Phlebia brevispora TaxID=194682 RepID=A0ACC1SHN9_9APHY|nr:hypothetical protein NM688_g6297 [Phlebia brevispora]
MKPHADPCRRDATNSLLGHHVGILYKDSETGIDVRRRDILPPLLICSTDATHIDVAHEPLLKETYGFDMNSQLDMQIQVLEKSPPPKTALSLKVVPSLGTVVASSSATTSSTSLSPSSTTSTPSVTQLSTTTDALPTHSIDLSGIELSTSTAESSYVLISTSVLFTTATVPTTPGPVHTSARLLTKTSTVHLTATVEYHLQQPPDPPITSTTEITQSIAIGVVSSSHSHLNPSVTKTSIPADSSPSNTESSSSSTHDGRKTAAAAISGLIGGCVLMVAVISLWIWWRRRKLGQQTSVFAFITRTRSQRNHSPAGDERKRASSTVILIGNGLGDEEAQISPGSASTASLFSNRGSEEESRVEESAQDAPSTTSSELRAMYAALRRKMSHLSSALAQSATSTTPSVPNSYLEDPENLNSTAEQRFRSQRQATDGGVSLDGGPLHRVRSSYATAMSSRTTLPPPYCEFLAY